MNFKQRTKRNQSLPNGTPSKTCTTRLPAPLDMGSATWVNFLVNLQFKGVCVPNQDYQKQLNNYIKRKERDIQASMQVHYK